MVTSSLIAGFGDSLCQGMELYISKDQNKKFNFKRTRTFLIMGGLYVAPILHLHYSYVLPYFVPNIWEIISISERYNYHLSTRPLVTKMITSGAIGAFGDLLCQTFENRTKKEKSYNLQRTKSFFLTGTFFIAPLLHLSYSIVLPRLVPELTTVGAIKKLALDQLVFAPVVVTMFYPVINFIEGKPFQQSIEDLKNKFIPTMITNYKIWPLANFINFTFIPIQYQVLWANMISLLFNACLSFIHNNKSIANQSNTKEQSKALGNNSD
ncbi:mpv17 pmp22 family protein [Stylonychia lemnae]|uniref:Mpv17 pmp22 family protein n=1 Tax=Stylonychia lemnae TaxID=5949 RepID=A0A078BB47_STYLE|nr:mpv17 pmp22 family protein [Stylonychia lemnae]|eukprot:CDW91795.1 mpv17 pmp22 family protein [Stylonychia lemnae]